jgi:tellurite resistance protein
MSDLHEEIEISQSEAEAIARGLFAVARADGQLHEREAGIIAQFYAEVASSSPSQLGMLERSPKIEASALAAALPGKGARQLFLKTALLLAYVDNAYAGGEAKLIGEYASAMGVARAELAELETQAKEFLMGQLSHLQNVDAVVEVSKKLGS